MDKIWMQGARFLIIDDQAYNISLLERILSRAGFSNLHCTTDPRQLEVLFEQIKPDIILLDLHMPDVDGFAALKLIQERVEEGHYLPILVLTADVTQEAKKEALHLGAHDFLTKPLDKTEVVLRIKNLLKTRFYHLQLQDQNQLLELRVQERTVKLEQAKLEILQLLGRTSEFRDDQTGQHTQRVGQMAKEIASSLGLSDHEASLIERATPLHDLGKLGIPDDILLKPGRFSPEEFEQMKTHTTIGASILQGSQFPDLQLAHTIALTHHEKWDGTGYPNGLRGEAIPLAGRIVALADFYDALTHERPYKRAWSTEEALTEIQKQRGLHFDPQVVDAFMHIVRKESYSN
ncbi:Cyclic di-GMP phosphodiesterase response regulator RpfG [Paenibacillus allorhizoplanae]|uniref:Cyclic di-GMP phosphodiesterase response regulator RpfG n=1 Tax=Paenibacillus allorhizoplanae TaxID=2905648 RepID=A0ABN8GQS4_9BACL|nr:HD domain-containing phosphohydrolase [Paenibacillus allorhizoplanae]CAH1215692.1 Cyclic di-GMP phosphodiesterase response regulator RpfG [Paenibacillus allorhizoplanae]